MVIICLVFRFVSRKVTNAYMEDSAESPNAKYKASQVRNISERILQAAGLQKVSMTQQESCVYNDTSREKGWSGLRSFFYEPI